MECFRTVQKNGGKENNSKLRENVILQYLEKYYSIEFSSKGGRPPKTPNPLRLTERYFIDIIPATASKANATKVVLFVTQNGRKGEK